MKCRSDCGACCIAPSIARPFYGMPTGKPAGVPCIHLDADMACSLFGDTRRPTLCADFTPETVVCGDSREQAMRLMTELEQQSCPGGGCV